MSERSTKQTEKVSAKELKGAYRGGGRRQPAGTFSQEDEEAREACSFGGYDISGGR